MNRFSLVADNRILTGVKSIGPVIFRISDMSCKNRNDSVKTPEVVLSTKKLLTCYLGSQYVMSSNPELGLASMYRIIKKSGAERVSDDAADELRKILEGIAEKIARQAVELSLHASRKTVKAEDVQLASKNVLGT